MTQEKPLSAHIEQLEHEHEYLKSQIDMIEKFKLSGKLELRSNSHFTSIDVSADDFRQNALNEILEKTKNRIKEIDSKLENARSAIS